MGILDLTQDKTGQEKESIRTSEIAKLTVPTGRYYSAEYDLEIEITSDITQILVNGKYGIEFLVKAWKNNEQLGFSKEGTIETERMRVFYQPFLVEDTKGDIVKTIELYDPQGNVVDTREIKLKEDPIQSILNQTAHTVSLVGKEGTSIIPGSVGHTDTTVYTNSDEEDGYAMQSTSSSDWTTLVGGAGNSSDDTSGSTWCAHFDANPTANKWNTITRGFFTFDTSAVGSDDIESVTLSLYGSLKVDQSGNWGGVLTNVYEGAPTDDNAVVDGDYDSAGSTEFATAGITYTNWSTTAYNNWTLNGTGENHINGSGTTSFSIRTENDADDSAPSHPSANEGWGLQCYHNENGSNEPKLVVVHSASGTAHSATISQSLSLTHTAPASTTYDMTVADSLSSVDTSPASATYGMTVVESLAASDTKAPQATFNKTISEVLGLSEVWSALKGYFISITEAISLSKVQSVALNFKTTVSETLSLSEVVATLKTLRATITETLSLINTQIVGTMDTYNIVITETISIVHRKAKRVWGWVSKATSNWTWTTKK